jgi:uncharacterized protein involved in outer membrane biogenesis
MISSVKCRPRNSAARLQTIELHANRSSASICNTAPSFSSTQPFAAAKEVYVSVALLSLIRGDPEVKNLALDQPRIELIKNPSGVWNFSTLWGAGQRATPQGGRSDQLTLDELKISDGQVAITNQAAKEPRSVYDHIDVKLTDFAPGKHSPAKGNGKCADSNLPVKPNGPSPFRASSRIFSDSDATC